MDATHKLTNLRMPLYVFLVSDGNGQSMIVATCLVSSEQRNVIDKMFSVFKSHNLPCIVGAAQCDRQDVQCVQVSQPALCRRSSAV